MGSRVVNLVEAISVAISVALFVTVSVFWVRSRSGNDQVLWTHYRWLTDGSAAGSHVELRSDSRLRISMGWGRVGPPNGQLVWGYYVNADQSRGQPRLEFHHERYDPLTKLLFKSERAFGRLWLPLTWNYAMRSAQRDGDDSVAFGVGVSHWLAAALVAILPAWAAWRGRGRFSLAGLIACVAAICVVLAFFAPLVRA